MTWYAIWENEPKRGQIVLITDRYGRMRVMSYKGKMENTTSNYKFAKIDYPEIYHGYLACDFRWTEIDSLPKFD